MILWNEVHCVFIRAKLKECTRDDVIDFAHNSDILRPNAVIRDVATSLRKFRSIALNYLEVITSIIEYCGIQLLLLDFAS